ncbi:cytochrome c [Tenacibaculum adriaticum]|uniref:Cytochrome c n=1 Tax=Tenacibaculum adriaticum TaxID=413713 RepID=A0A5S5DS57_9FLAO|nr:c-type cytochrome [Tenacibaculum adriaticum]TYP98753.1 cytochrome c [Tenacibaculum adriaticum]
MKYFFYSTAFVTVISLFSCGNNKKEVSYGKPKEIKTESKTQEKPLKNVSTIAKGKALFTEKTCTTCHQTDKKVIGPSIKEITETYNKENASILLFLQSKSNPIVDIDPGQIAVMKANLDGFVKEMKEEELKSIELYMLSIK